MKKLTDLDIEWFVRSVGYTLLKFLDERHRKLLIRCNRGHEYPIMYPSLRHGTKCRKCWEESQKLDFNMIKDYVETTGEVLLSTAQDYVTNASLLSFKCPHGCVYRASWIYFKRGTRCEKHRCKVRLLSVKGANNPMYKGGVTQLNLPLYETYAPKLSKYQTVYEVEKDGLLLVGVACVYCGTIFVPTITAVKARLSSLYGRGPGEANLYCSENCKKACPTYGQIKYPKGFKVSTSREVQPELRKLVLSRDNFQCQICGVGIEEAELHCHHIEPVSQNPIESADVDNCIILCKNCHKQAHTLPGCSYNELKCDR
jgi:hypothetical protein